MATGSRNSQAIKQLVPNDKAENARERMKREILLESQL